MTVEDRIRAAARARTGLVREIRPLDIPERLPRRRPRIPRPRRWIGWLAPVTAAAVVVALAIALVSVRQARNDGGVPRPAPVLPVSGAAIPRYYVSVSPGVSGATPATVADSRTGAVLATVRPPALRAFAGVAGAADDRTFVLDTVPAGGPNGQGAHVWYLLRIAPGTGHPAALTRLPVAGPPASVQIQGLALSPDGQTLALLFRPGMPDTGGSGVASAAGDAPAAPVTLRTYSLATGRALRTLHRQPAAHHDHGRPDIARQVHPAAHLPSPQHLHHRRHRLLTRTCAGPRPRAAQAPTFAATLRRVRAWRFQGPERRA